MGHMMAMVTEQLARFIADLEWKDLPGEVVEVAKQSVLDNIGCAVGGYRVKPGRIAADLVMEYGGRQDASVWATSSRIPDTDAAYCNSYLANVLDFDDILSDGHLGATIIPPAVALAERLHRTGRDLVTAIVAGYEVSARIGWAIRPSPEQFRLVRGAGTFQIFGAVAAASKLLGLSIEEIRMAFGVAGACAPIPSVYKQGWDERPLSWVKNNYGWVSKGGLLAAHLASRGFRGNLSFLDGERGFWRMAGSDRCDNNKMVWKLGEEYLILSNRFKRYSCCYYDQPAIDAMKALLSENRLSKDDVDQIVVTSFGRLADHMERRPTSIIDAQFSVPFWMASLVQGRVTSYDWHLKQATGDAETCRLADRVHFKLDPDFERRFSENREYIARVSIHTQDGRVVTREMQFGKNDATSGLSEAEMACKFSDLCMPVLGQRRSTSIMEKVRSMESIGDISGLLQLGKNKEAGNHV